MSRISGSLLAIVLTALLFATGCKKDELTVVSTAPHHTCGLRTIEVNVDSLVQCCGGWGNVPELHFDFCSCDTVRLVPSALEEPWEFERWFFGTWPFETNYWDPVLDTITTATEVTLDVHNDESGSEPDHLHIRLHLDEMDCK